MIAVADILDEAADALGVCADNTAFIFRRLNLAVKLLAQKGEWDPLNGEVRVLVNGQCFALPRDVETVHAVNLDGRPTIGRDRYFDYHFNGPGEEAGLALEWEPKGTFATFFEVPTPCRIGYAFVDSVDQTSNVSLSFYGLDANGSLIENADLPPNNVGYSFGSQTYARIDRIRKGVSRGPVEIKAYPLTGDVPFTIAILEGPDTESKFVRISIGRPADVVRVAFRRRVFAIRSVNDVIPLHSEMAILSAVKAVRHYLDDDPDLGGRYEAEAARMLTEKEFFSTPSVARPIQVSGLNHIHDKSDEMS